MRAITTTRILTVTLVSFGVFTIVPAKPIKQPSFAAGSPLSLCYTLICPKETALCGKYSEVSAEDKGFLNVQIRCYDDEGNIIRSKNSTESNPYGQGVYYKSTKLTAGIDLLRSYFDDDGIEDGFDGEDGDHSSTLSHKPTVIRGTSAGPKSEVEDLNT